MHITKFAKEDLIRNVELILFKMKSVSWKCRLEDASTC